MAKRPLKLPDRSQVTDDTPLRLEVAAELAFPGGGMTASGLRKERDAGRLITEMVAGREFTTLRDIARMREACRGLRKGRASGPNPIRTADTDDGSAAQAHALLKLAALRRGPG